MARWYRRWSEADEDEVWVLLRAGHAAKPTARLLGLPTGTVRAYLVRCGGIRSPRRRSTAWRPHSVLCRSGGPAGVCAGEASPDVQAGDPPGAGSR